MSLTMTVLGGKVTGLVMVRFKRRNRMVDKMAQNVKETSINSTTLRK